MLVTKSVALVTTSFYPITFGCDIQFTTDYKSVITLYVDFKPNNKFQTHQNDFMSLKPVKIPNIATIFIAKNIIRWNTPFSAFKETQMAKMKPSTKVLVLLYRRL